MRVERVGEGLRLVDDGRVDGAGRTHDQLIEQPQTLAEGFIQRARTLDELVVERLGAVGERGVEGARVLFEDGLQVLGAIAERAVELLQLIVEGDLHLLGAGAEGGAKGGGVVLQHVLQLLGAPADGGLETADARCQRGFEAGQVLARALDDLGQLDLLVRQLLDQRRNFAAEPHQALGDAIGRIHQGVAFAGKLGNEAADLALVVLVGALEHADLVVHHGFELAGAPEGARDGVVHEADLAAHGLAERGGVLLGETVGLGQADGDLGHGRGSQAQLLGAPGENGHQPQQGDRHDDGGDGEECRRAREQLEPADHRPGVGDRGEDEGNAEAAPDDARHAGELVGRVGRLLLQGEDEAADAGAVVVGGDAVARGTGGAAARHAAARDAVGGLDILLGRLE